MLCNYAECHYAQCRILFTIMLNVAMLNVIMLSVVVPKYIHILHYEYYILSYFYEQILDLAKIPPPPPWWPTL